MLPYLKNRMEGSVSAPVETVERTPDNPDEEMDMLDAVAEDLLSAIEKRSKPALKAALAALCTHIQMMDEEQDETLGEQDDD